jgi:hypothetical protein
MMYLWTKLICNLVLLACGRWKKLVDSTFANSKCIGATPLQMSY